jgi:hypothetical protein
MVSIYPLLCNCILYKPMNSVFYVMLNDWLMYWKEVAVVIYFQALHDPCQKC